MNSSLHTENEEQLSRIIIPVVTIPEKKIPVFFPGQRFRVPVGENYVAKNDPKRTLPVPLG